MEQVSRARGGRPRGFDRSAAIDTALQLFWRHGYEGVSIGDLTAAIGIAAPSLYAAFGSKAELFREVVERYETVVAPADLSVFDTATSLHDGVDAFMRASVFTVTRAEGERGCMISTGMLFTGAAHGTLARDMAERRAAFRNALAEKLCRFLSSAEAASLARTLTAVLQGIAVQARDGADVRELERIGEWMASHVTVEASRT